MKKILVATGLYPPEIGGPATYVQMLEGELPKAGIELVVVPFGTVRHLPKLVRHIAFAWALFKSVRGCDAVYALDPVSVGLPALLVSRLSRKPFLIRLGGDYAWEQGRIRFGLTETLDEYTDGASHRPVAVRVLAWLQSFVVRRARCVIAPSAYLKRIITTWGVPEKNIHVVYSALFPLPVSESKEIVREKLSYEGVVLVSAGRLAPWKGFKTLIDVVAELRKERDDITLVIAGDGGEHAALVAYAEERNVAEHIRFVGRLSKEALGASIFGADVYVSNPSYEGLPHQLLEVMDLGVPTITTTIEGNREVVRDGVHGLLVSPNDTAACIAGIKRLLENKTLRDRIIQSARIRAKDFAQERVTKQLVEVLETIV